MTGAATSGRVDVNGGAAVVRTLEAHGVRTVFGIPGTHNLEIYRHLATSSIRVVTTRHEQGAGYAADGYAQVARSPGVVVTTTGPGTLNAATAIATSYAESRPVLLISSGLPGAANDRDLGELHDTKDVLGAMSLLTAWSVRPRTPEEVVDAIAQAFTRFDSERPRPVCIEIPVDVIESAWSGQAIGPTPYSAVAHADDATLAGRQHYSSAAKARRWSSAGARSTRRQRSVIARSGSTRSSSRPVTARA